MKRKSRPITNKRSNDRRSSVARFFLVLFGISQGVFVWVPEKISPQNLDLKSDLHPQTPMFFQYCSNGFSLSS